MSETPSCKLLLISGSLRDGSTNTAVLRTAAEVAPADVSTELYGDMRSLPHFSPDDDAEGAPVHPAVAALRAALWNADAVLICTPEYAGALPGSLKLALEWTVGDGSTYDKPIAWINAASVASPTGAADAHDSLRKVLGYVHADIVEDACVRVPIARSDRGPDGLIANPDARAAIAGAVVALARHVAAREQPAG